MKYFNHIMYGTYLNRQGKWHHQNHHPFNNSQLSLPPPSLHLTSSPSPVPTITYHHANPLSILLFQGRPVWWCWWFAQRQCSKTATSCNCGWFGQKMHVLHGSWTCDCILHFILRLCMDQDMTIMCNARLWSFQRCLYCHTFTSL